VPWLGTLARESGHAPMNAAEFEECALALVAQGYSPLVIAPRCPPRPDGRKVPEGKAPGVRVGGEWQLAHGWDQWCYKQVSEHLARAWCRMIGTAEDAGIGVALGRGLICIDIDQEFLLDPILAILPASPIQKKEGRASHCSVAATPIRSGRATIGLTSASVWGGPPAIRAKVCRSS
jgi:hypothetical protein